MEHKSSGVSRRKFLAAAATGIVGAGVSGLVPEAILAQATEPAAKPDSGNIIYRRLGRTNMQVPIVSMGVMNANVPDVVQASYEAGVRHFDTAAIYQMGRNEQMVGQVIGKLGVRDKVNIATKIYAPRQRVDDPAEIKKKIFQLTEGSLRRLRMDYVDIMHVHDVNNADVVKNEAIMEALAELKEQKKILATGITTHTNMAEVINAVTEGGFYDVVVTSFNFTMADDDALLAALKAAAEKGVGIVAMKTLAGGSRWPNPESRRQYESSVIISAALKWVMNNASVTTSIPGYDNFEHMKQDFAIASNLEYTNEEKKFLSDNDVKVSLGFCRQCGSCLASCPNDADIPTLMRTHMYAAQYANFGHARQTLDDIPARRGLSACASCSQCSAGCANSVDIARRIDELKQIYA